MGMLGRQTASPLTQGRVLPILVVSLGAGLLLLRSWGQPVV